MSKTEIVKLRGIVCNYCGFPFDAGDPAIYDDNSGQWYCCTKCQINDQAREV